MAIGNTCQRSPEKRIKLSVRKTFLFSIIPMTVLFVIGEVGLRIAGYRSGIRDPYESFVQHRPLFEAQGKEMVTAPSRTRFFHSQRFARAKPQEVVRFFVFGGSASYGYALENSATDNYVGLLAHELRKNQPHLQFEGINCGGICYASYRLVGLVDEALAYSPDFVVIMSGHNEFLEPRHYSELSKKHGTGSRLWHSLRLVQLTGETVERLRSTVHQLRTAPEKSEWVLESEYIGERYIVRDEKEHENTLLHYRHNLNEMASLCEEKGIPVIFCTLASNLRDQQPVVTCTNDKLSKEAMSRRFSEATQLYEADQFRDALAVANGVLDDNSRAAAFHFIAAKSLDAMARPDEAKLHYLQAKDTDGFPHRTLSSFNGVIRDICRERRLFMVDIEAAFATSSEDGIVGANLFLDDCHPTKSGHALIAAELAKAVDKHIAPGWSQE